MTQHLIHTMLMAIHDRNWQPTVADLATATGLPRSTVSRYATRLIARRWIREAIDPKDRRRRVLQPTSLGTEIRQANARDIIALLTRMIALTKLGNAKPNVGPNSLDEMVQRAVAMRGNRS